MSKSLSVKVKTPVLIKALEEALALREKRWANQEKDKAIYEKAVEAYNEAILKLIKKGVGELSDVSERYHYHMDKKDNKLKSFTVTVKLPKLLVPAEPKEVDTISDHIYTRETDAIKQAMRLLKMTDQEYVNASTYKSVAEYL